jgi:ornithine cyclodeaminase/alanine dehydrogenase
MSTVLLTRSDVAKLVAMPEVIAAVEGAFAAHGRGAALMPPKVYLDLPVHRGDFRAMPAYLPADGDRPARAGVKWVNSHPENPRKHALPSVMGAYLLSDPETAEPLVLMDATLLTAMRTGAAGAVATRHLGPAEPKTIGFVGCGVQAEVLWQAHKVLWPELVVLAADLDPTAAMRFAKTHGGRVATLVEAAGADVVCTSTPVRAPVVKTDWVKPGAHVNAMGADAPGKQELESALVAVARVFVDDPHQAFHSGEVNVPLHEGTIAEAGIAGTLGEVIAGAKRGRLSAREVTVFDSTGLAIQDLAVARVVEAEAKRRGIGRAVELLE